MRRRVCMMSTSGYRSCHWSTSPCVTGCSAPEFRGSEMSMSRGLGVGLGSGAGEGEGEGAVPGACERIAAASSGGCERSATAMPDVCGGIAMASPATWGCVTAASPAERGCRVVRLSSSSAAAHAASHFFSLPQRSCAFTRACSLRFFSSATQGLFAAQSCRQSSSPCSSRNPSARKASVNAPSSPCQSAASSMSSGVMPERFPSVRNLAAYAQSWSSASSASAPKRFFNLRTL